MNSKQIYKLGDASYYGGATVGLVASLAMIRRMAQSDLASAWTLRPTPWLRLARRHKVLTALYLVAVLAQLAGMVIRGPRLQPAASDPELFPEVPKVDERWHTAEDNSGLVLDADKGDEVQQ